MEAELNRPCIFDGYKELNRKYDPHLGEYSIRKNPKGADLVMVKDRQTTSKSEAIKILNSLAKRKEMKLPHLMQLRDFSCRDDSHLCGTFYNYTIYYEYYDASLPKFKSIGQESPTGFDALVLTKLIYDMVG